MTAETISVRCCIAGGGPAGMMLGYLLARAGVEVIFHPGLKASIVARKMVRRAIAYPLMMWAVWAAEEHLTVPLEQPVNS